MDKVQAELLKRVETLEEQAAKDAVQIENLSALLREAGDMIRGQHKLLGKLSSLYQNIHKRNILALNTIGSHNDIFKMIILELLPQEIISVDKGLEITTILANNFKELQALVEEIEE